MEKIIVIGLSGVPGSGKDELARQLSVSRNFQRLAFADGIRGDLLKLNPFIGAVRLSEVVEQYGWDEAKRLFPEVRRLLQIYGSEVGRDGFGERCWINRVDQQILGSTATRFAITDVRFPNEVNYHSQFYGPLWYVERPGKGVINNHASERHYEEIKALADAVIVNDGTIEDLGVKANTEIARWLTATNF